MRAAWGSSSLSFLACWLFARQARKGLPALFERLSKGDRVRVQTYLGPVIIGLLGQIVINNSDILIVNGTGNSIVLR